ncbi:MAG: hypothetical protein MUF24_03790 [Chitinophagaceae bacterium]|nr:hypothetical protein [Chitinophagaceae bacterium]
MNKQATHTKITENQDLIKEYQEIVNASKASVIIDIEWEREGDNFRKLTIYDHSYTPIPTLGETTLINAL